MGKSVYKQQKAQKRRFKGIIKKLNRATTESLQSGSDGYELDSLRYKLDVHYRRPKGMK